jgi:hypothetical protein
MFRGIPDVSLFIYIAQCSCRKSHASFIICTFAPDWRCFIITSLMNTTSESFIVRSSSFLYKIKYHILKYLQSLTPANDHVTYLPSHILLYFQSHCTQIFTKTTPFLLIFPVMCLDHPMKEEHVIIIPK